MSGIINEGKSFLTPKTNKQAGITDYSNLGIARNTIMGIPGATRDLFTGRGSFAPQTKSGIARNTVLGVPSTIGNNILKTMTPREEAVEVRTPFGLPSETIKTKDAPIVTTAANAVYRTLEMPVRASISLGLGLFGKKDKYNIPQGSRVGFENDSFTPYGVQQKRLSRNGIRFRTPLINWIQV